MKLLEEFIHSWAKFTEKEDLSVDVSFPRWVPKMFPKTFKKVLDEIRGNMKEMLEAIEAEKMMGYTQ
jgi:hypothetical protein